MRIYLIGMMGCGKSTLGRELAARLGYRFIDMDEYIEHECCMFISEIFDAYGEEWFRAFESNTLSRLAGEENVVIATGGGIIKNPENKKRMEGKCIFLNVPAYDLEKRLLGTEETRPMLKYKTPSEILKERMPLYLSFADQTVENTDMEKAIKEIMETL